MRREIEKSIRTVSKTIAIATKDEKRHTRKCAQFGVYPSRDREIFSGTGNHVCRISARQIKLDSDVRGFVAYIRPLQKRSHKREAGERGLVTFEIDSARVFTGDR